jgi:Transposase.
MSVEQISDICGVSVSTIYNYIHKNDLEVLPTGRKGGKYRDAEWLNKKYNEQGYTTNEIADMCDVSEATISQHLIRNNINTREPGTTHTTQKFNNEDWLRQKYIEEEMSLAEIADKFEVHYSTILDRMNQFGIETRSMSEAIRLKRGCSKVSDKELKEVFE